MTWIKVAVFSTLCCAAASAGPITFTVTLANASGSLDGTSFSGQTVTLVLKSDTSTINNLGGGFYQDPGTATVNVSGLGTDTFTDSMAADVNQAGEYAGITDKTAFFDVLDVGNVAFASYSLSTSIGPLSGGTSGNSGTAFNTTGGTFEITSPLNVDHPATFTASTPEPGTLGLIGAGIGLLLIGRRRGVALGR